MHVETQSQNPSKMTDKAWAMLILILLLIGSIILNVWQSTQLRYFYNQPQIESFDNFYVKKAIALWSKKAAETPAEIMSYRYPKVMYFDEKACVELSFRRPDLGGEPVYCFDRRNERLVGRYDDVE